jgi:hypothetical protein
LFAKNDKKKTEQYSLHRIYLMGMYLKKKVTEAIWPKQEWSKNALTDMVATAELG